MGLMRFPRIKNAPRAKLWVGGMTNFGLSDLVKTVDSKFGTTLTVKLEFSGMVFKCDNVMVKLFWVCSIRINNTRIFFYCANKHCSVFVNQQY